MFDKRESAVDIAEEANEATTLDNGSRERLLERMRQRILAERVGFVLSIRKTL